jgi:hypothetical protein
MTEPRKKKPRRASDRWLPKLLIVSTLVNLLCVGLLTVGSVGIISNKQALERAEEALERIDTEAVERKDADCVKDERDYFAKVNQLTQTYAFLKTADPESDLYKAVVTNLPQVEAEAKRDLAPEYCDEPNVGLPEPDPVVPKRPAGL